MNKNFNNLKKKFHKSLANNVKQIIIQNKVIYSFNIFRLMVIKNFRKIYRSYYDLKI
jgi:hypothetical protein